MTIKNKYHQTYARETRGHVLHCLRNTVMDRRQNNRGEVVWGTYGEYLDGWGPDVAQAVNNVVKNLLDAHLQEGPMKQVQAKRMLANTVGKDRADALDQAIKEALPAMRIDGRGR